MAAGSRLGEQEEQHEPRRAHVDRQGFSQQRSSPRTNQARNPAPTPPRPGSPLLSSYGAAPPPSSVSRRRDWRFHFCLETSSRPPLNPQPSPPQPGHSAAAGTHRAVSRQEQEERSDGGGLAADEDGEGRGDGARRGDHLGHRRRHLVRRAPCGAPRRAPGPHPDAQDVRHLRGHLRHHRRPLHRRRAARAEPAQEARLRQRGRRRVRRWSLRLRLQRKEYSVSLHWRLLPGLHICCAGHWRQYNQSGQWQRVLCLHN